MKINSASEMLELGRRVAKDLDLPAVIELVGDVGAGKTTFTQGLAEGLGVLESVTSPSFTISKRYLFDGGELIHYDFYRLNEPGIMREEIAENLTIPNAVVVVEWGEAVTDLLPEDKLHIEFKLLNDGAREVLISNPKTVTEQR